MLISCICSIAVWLLLVGVGSETTDLFSYVIDPYLFVSSVIDKQKKLIGLVPNKICDFVIMSVIIFELCMHVTVKLLGRRWGKSVRPLTHWCFFNNYHTAKLSFLVACLRLRLFD